MLLSSTLAPAVRSQAVDSVHVFKAIPSVTYSTSLAETTGWKLQRAGAPFVSVGASDLVDINRDLEQRRPARHVHTTLRSVSHLGFIYLDKAAHVFCLADDESLIIDLTARRQYRIEDWTDRMKLKATLLALGL